MSKNFSLCRLDGNSNQVISLQGPEKIIISREFLKCNDKRVSRHHGEIQVLDNQIMIKSCHHNPIFYKTKENNQEQTLMKPNEVALSSNDKFSLLPNSELEYEVRIAGNSEQENLAGTLEPTTTTGIGFRVKGITEIIGNLEAGMPTSLSQIIANDSVITSDHDRTPSPDVLFAQANSRVGAVAETLEPATSVASRKRSIDETPNSNDESSKRLKTSSTDAGTSTTTISSEAVKIKPDPDSTSGDSAVTSLPTLPLVIKPDPDAPDSGSSSSTTKVKIEKTEENQTALRPSCSHGIRCYRQTTEHRREVAHPYDIDYRRPDFPSAPQGIPECPWGASCYRRNPDHFRNLQHPPANVYSVQPTGPTTPAIAPQIPMQPPRNNNNNNNNLDVDDEEDEAFEDFDDSEADADFVDNDFESAESASGEDNNLEE